MRFLAPVTFAAISGVVLWKLFATLILPFLALMFGLMMSVVKAALIIAVIYFVFSMIRKRREEASV